MDSKRINGRKAGDIFTAAGTAFTRLGEFAVQLHSSSGRSAGAVRTSWTEEEMNMLDSCVKQFGNDLETIADKISIRQSQTDLLAVAEQQLVEDIVKGNSMENTLQRKSPRKGRHSGKFPIEPRSRSQTGRLGTGLKHTQSIAARLRQINTEPTFPSPHKIGSIPTYLRKRQEAWKREDELKKSEMERKFTKAGRPPPFVNLNRMVPSTTSECQQDQVKNLNPENFLDTCGNKNAMELNNQMGDMALGDSIPNQSNPYTSTFIGNGGGDVKDPFVARIEENLAQMRLNGGTHETSTSLRHRAFVGGSGTGSNPGSSLSLVNHQNHEAAGQPTHKIGAVPKYLKQRQQQWEDEKNARVEAEKTAHIPPGHVLMSETDRLDTVSKLQDAYNSRIVELNRIPIRIDTMRVRNYRKDLEDELTKLEQTMKLFSRPNVCVKLDQQHEPLGNVLLPKRN